MCQTQKHAWFNVAVVAGTLVSIAILYPVLGKGAFGGLGFLGLLGFGVLFYRRKRSEVVTDERDDLIRRRSMAVAYTVFWLAFVSAGVVAPWYYSDVGAVPVVVVQSAFWLGWVLLVTAQSVATLVQFGRGGLDARTE